MNEVANLTFALLAGSLLGAMFFGGLWWTVAPRQVRQTSRALAARQRDCCGRTRPWQGSISSVAGDGERLAACLVGFVLARMRHE